MLLDQPLKPKTSLASWMALSPARYGTLAPEAPGLVDMYSGPSLFSSRLDKVAISRAVYSLTFDLVSSNGLSVAAAALC